MRPMEKSTVVLAVTAMFAAYGCGSGNARQTARAPSPARTASMDTPGTTATTSAALVVRTTSTSITTTTPTTTTTAAAITRVTSERCDRAATCNQVGTGHAYGDRDECMNAVGHDVVTSLSDDVCPSGVDPDRLAACVSAVKANPCDADAKAAALPSSCAREQLCAGSVAAREPKTTVSDTNAAPSSSEGTSLQTIR